MTSNLDLQKQRKWMNAIPLALIFTLMIGFAYFSFEIIEPFIGALFAAAVTTLVCAPVHARILRRWPRRPRLVAFLVTTAIFLFFVIPTVTVAWTGIEQLGDLVSLQTSPDKGTSPLLPTVKSFMHKSVNPMISKIAVFVPYNFDQISQGAIRVAADLTGKLYDAGMKVLASLPSVSVGVFVFFLATYFFFLDGSSLWTAWASLGLLRKEHENALKREFTLVIRGVVLGTLLAAVVQASIFVVAMALITMFTTIEWGNWILLLGMLTVFAALVPLFGTTVVWVPTAIVFLLLGHMGAAIVLVVVGSTLIAAADNVVKVWAIQGAVKLHPLLVFITVFGGLQLMGLIGIFVGPVVGAILFALARVFREEMRLAHSDTTPTP